jgi:predicted NBD/HSP70 family sugar kinase
VGKGQSTRRGGKRPTLIKLNPNSGFVIGIEIKRTHASVALATIESEIRGRARLLYRADEPFERIISNIFIKINALLKRFKIKRDRLISIGIALPGFIDYAKGELLFADTLRGWMHVPLAARFAEKYNLPVSIENDANAIALGEYMAGAGRGALNIACIWIGDGIGCGIMVDAQLVRGETGNAGEIGYLELGHFVCDDHSIKYLHHGERYFGQILSEANLWRTLQKELPADSPLSGATAPTLETLLDAAGQGQQPFQKILDEYAFFLAILCTNLIKTLNPSRIILNGHVIEKSPYLLQRLRSVVEERLFGIPFQSSSLIPGELKDDAGVKGAITLALQTIFEPPVTKSKNLSE